MLAKYQLIFTFNVTLFLLISISYCLKDDRNRKQLEENDSPSLTGDDISYALSELSMNDLNALNQLMDAIHEYEDPEAEGDAKSQLSGEVERFKRENPDEQPENAQENFMPNVDEEYIKLLADSFPNVAQSNQDGKDREHIRVKRT